MHDSMTLASSIHLVTEPFGAAAIDSVRPTSPIVLPSLFTATRTIRKQPCTTIFLCRCVMFFFDAFHRDCYSCDLRSIILEEGE
jgi:hypothetical protein